jgi:hypothetical protein
MDTEQSSSDEYHRSPSPPWKGDLGVISIPMEVLGGEFAIQTDLKGNFLTADGGGGRTVDVIRTNESQVTAWEKFRLWVDSATHQYYALQTADGHFITANGGGGLTSDTIHSDATAIQAWETFKLLPQPNSWQLYAIQTLKGYLLTALGGGGHSGGDTLHTDAVHVAEWERFRILRNVDFGTGSTYAIEAKGGPLTGGYLTATGGGNQPLGQGHALMAYSGIPFEISFTLLKQGDGTYALQTASGRVVTAIAGGLVGEGFRTDTEADEIGNWEKFTLVDAGRFTSYIKTYAGTYLTTRIDGFKPVVTVSDPNEATAWRFHVAAFG